MINHVSQIPDTVTEKVERRGRPRKSLDNSQEGNPQSSSSLNQESQSDSQQPLLPPPQQQETTGEEVDVQSEKKHLQDLLNLTTTIPQNTNTNDNTNNVQDVLTPTASEVILPLQDDAEQLQQQQQQQQ